MNLLTRLFSRRRLYGDLSAEIEEHLNEKIDELVAGGMSRAEATRTARREFGNVTLLEERSREVWQWPFIESFFADVRFALRMLRKSPGFTAVAILTLALGIGANVSMLGVVDALMFRLPEHVRAPGQLVVAGLVTKEQPNQSPVLSYYQYQQLAANAHLVDIAAEVLRARVGFGQGAAARPIYASYISHRYFQVLGGRMPLGRWFSAEEDQPTGSQPVVVLGYDLWQRAFEGDPSVVGRTVQIDGQGRTVVGVAPEGFTGTGFLRLDAWLPISAFREIPLPNLLLTIVGRLRNGASADQAAAEMTSLLQQGGALGNQVVRVEPLFGSRWKTLSSNGRVSRWIAVVALIVFLIACANVSSLELARVAQRRHEMAIRQHLGATRARVMRQVLIEGLLLGAAGGLAALVVALMVQPLVRAFLLPEGFYGGGFLSWRLLATAAVLATLAGCGSGLAPAWRASDSHLAETLKRGEREHTREGSGLRRMLVVAQIALALLLAVGAGLFVRSLSKVDAIDLGFEPKHLLQATLDLPLGQASQGPVGVGAAYARLRARAEQVPGVADAALANMLTVTTELTFTERLDSGKTVHWTATPRAVTPNYFQTMGTPILKGRPLLDSDTEGAEPVVVVSESIARAIWPDQNPLGKCMRTGLKPLCARVVGMVPDAWPSVSLGDRGHGAPAQFYVPLRQAKAQGTALPAPDGLLVRTKVMPSAVTRNLFSALENVSPGGRYVDIEPYTKMLDEQTRSWRMGASMFSLFGGLALALAAVGIYGVVAFLVRQRTHEIGVRMALGAQRGDVLRMVIREGMVLAGVGIVLGIAGALALTRFLRSLLFKIKPTDPAAFVGVAILLSIVALAACYIPARRAMRVDPMVALRYE
ncbi:MAG: ABC transporter permease [Candidatus Acidiferrales bacterium]